MYSESRSVAPASQIAERNFLPYLSLQLVQPLAHARQLLHVRLPSESHLSSGSRPALRKHGPALQQAFSVKPADVEAAALFRAGLLVDSVPVAGP